MHIVATEQRSRRVFAGKYFVAALEELDRAITATPFAQHSLFSGIPLFVPEPEKLHSCCRACSARASALPKTSNMPVEGYDKDPNTNPAIAATASLPRELRKITTSLITR